MLVGVINHFPVLALKSYNSLHIERLIHLVQMVYLEHMVHIVYMVNMVHIVHIVRMVYIVHMAWY